MDESRSSRNSTSGRVENQLKTIELRARKIQKERITVVYLGMNERGNNSLSSVRVEGISDSTMLMNREARCRYRADITNKILQTRYDHT